MTYARAQEVVGRGVALLVALGLLVYPYLLPSAGLPIPAEVSAGYAQFVRWSGLVWLGLAFAPWSRLAPAVRFWPGADPHNLYGGAAVALAILSAMALIWSLLVPFALVLAVLGKPPWGHLLSGLFAAAFGTWALRSSRRMQLLAAERDQANDR